MNQKVMKNLEMLGAAFTLHTNIPAYQSRSQLTHHQQLLTASLKETLPPLWRVSPSLLRAASSSSSTRH